MGVQQRFLPILAVMLACAGSAGAQTVVELTSESTTQTFTTTTGEVFLPPQIFTRLNGTLTGVPGGGSATILFPDTIASPAGQTALNAVGAALTAQSAFRVRLSAPTFVGSTTQTAVPRGTTTTTSTVAGAPEVISLFDVEYNTTTIPIGNRGLCASPGVGGSFFPSAPPGAALPSGCQNNTPVYNAGTGEIIYLTNTNTPIITTTTITNFYGDVTTDTYAVTGTPIVQLGTTHALTRVGALLDLERLGTRLLDDFGDPRFFETAERPWTVFVQPFGGIGHINAVPSRYIPGARSEFGGVTAGVGGLALPNLTLGWVVDVSRISMETNDSVAPDASTLDLIKTGPVGSYRLGPVAFTALAVIGRGDSSNRSGSEAVGGTARSSYGLTTMTGGFDTTLDLRLLFDIPVSVQVGYQYARVETGGFTESGSPFAIQGFSGSAERDRAWIGAVYRDRIRVGPVNVDARAYLRGMTIWGNSDGASRAIFANFPSAGPFTISGPETTGLAGQWGAQARVPFLGGAAQITYDGQAGAGVEYQVFAARVTMAF